MSDTYPTPMCPRCGYDLSGLVSTWLASCPMEGLCSECGLEFHCAHVMSPSLIGPKWSYEHSLARSSRRWWATSWVSLWPWRLCRELWVDHRLRVGRVLRFGLIWALVIHLSAFALTLGSAVMTGSNIPVVYRMGSWQYPDLWNPEFWMQAGRMLAFPYAFDMIIPRGFASSVRPPLGPIFLLIFGPALLMPMWMTLLGSSMQIARVRPVHLLRGLCLSLPGAAAWVILTLAAIVVTEVFTSFPAPGVASVAILAWLPYHLTWWYLFVRVYLRLRHAAAVVILNAVMSVLLIVVSFVLLMLIGIRF